MMAALLGRPLVLHEQNSVAGLANRVLAARGRPRAERLPRGAGTGLGWQPGARRDRRGTAAGRTHAPDGRAAARAGGGWQPGRSVLNETVPRRCCAAEQRPVVVHQAGERQIEALRAAVHARARSTASCAFIDDMAAAYADADLVICRAGALTVAELAAAGVASLLVPFPTRWTTTRPATRASSPTAAAPIPAAAIRTNARPPGGHPVQS